MYAQVLSAERKTYSLVPPQTMFASNIGEGGVVGAGVLVLVLGVGVVVLVVGAGVVVLVVGVGVVVLVVGVGVVVLMVVAVSTASCCCSEAITSASSWSFGVVVIGVGVVLLVVGAEFSNILKFGCAGTCTNAELKLLDVVVAVEYEG